MSIKLKRTTKFILVTLCVALLIANTLILAPEVGAARGTDKTETINTIIDNISDPVEVELALSRAIVIDAAKKEAHEAVEKQLSIIAEEQKKEEETQAPTEASVQETDAQVQTTSYDDEDDDEDYSSSYSDSSYESSSGSSYVTGASDGGYLMDIDNPDPSYTPYAISLSDSDRDKIERVVMRESGYCGYTAMALVAQCMRDAWIRSGAGSADAVISNYGYSGSLSMTPTADCKDVVSYIFDQGGSAVQHRLLFYYASDYCSSSWHESQNYICAIGAERFFDAWN
ncbi:MAG: hypothetical protein IJH32_01155 [Ruminococcus sp.]|nr:hypothetical protein [Ruminococcus sp.]